MLTTLRHAARHEAAHVRVAQFFGLPVERVEVHPDGSGLTVVGGAWATDADALFKSAVIAAAGVMYDRLNRVMGADHEADRAAVEKFRQAFREAAGREMDDPFEAAGKLLNYGFVYGDVFDRIVAALESRRVLTGTEIEAAVRGVQPAVESMRRTLAAQYGEAYADEWAARQPPPK